MGQVPHVKILCKICINRRTLKIALWFPETLDFFRNTLGSAVNPHVYKYTWGRRLMPLMRHGTEWGSWYGLANSITNPGSPSHRKGQTFIPLTSLNSTVFPKHRIYESFFCNFHERWARAVPIPILGGRLIDAYMVQTYVARNVAVRTMEAYGRARVVV